MVSGFRCPSIHIFHDMGGEAGASAPKGSMTYAFTYGEFCSRPGIKQVFSSRLVGVNGKGVS